MYYVALENDQISVEISISNAGVLNSIIYGKSK